LTNGDNITATNNCSATSSSPAGTYSIVPSLVDPNDRQTNYNVTLINGTLTVTQAVSLAFTYTTNAGAITITGYTGPGGAVTIPAYINGLPVTGIAAQAFYGVTNLASVSISGSVTSIGEEAFKNCIALTNVFIPAGVTNIGLEAFGACVSLTAITVDTNNLSYSSVNGVLFDAAQTTLVEFPGGINGANAIPATVTNLADYSFFGCSKLASVTIPASVTAIGDYAFQGCANLICVYFNGNAPNPTPDSTVFTGDINATIYYLQGSLGWSSPFAGLTAVPTTAPGLFAYTPTAGAITVTGYNGPPGAVSIPPIINGLPVTRIAAGGGENSSSLFGAVVSLIIPASVTNIGDYAFYTCLELTNVTIPDSVTSVGYEAFASCPSLTSVTIPANLTNIGAGVFSACPNLTAITVDTNNSFFSSVNGVLFDKSQTTLIQFPGGMGGLYAIPGSVTSIGTEAFFGCHFLTNVMIPGSVTSMGSNAFFGCFGLVTVILDYGVTNIGDYAFFNCSSLTGVMIPNSVTKIGEWAFSGNAEFGGYACALTTVSIPGSVTSIGIGAFAGCPLIGGVTIGNGVTCIGTYAFQGCGPAELTIPASVTNIGDYAFFCYGEGYGSLNRPVYFTGNAPAVSSNAFNSEGFSYWTLYYLPGTSGWNSTLGGAPTALYNVTSPESPNQAQFYYTANAGDVTIVGFNGVGGTLNIPATIAGLPVTSIGDYAFDGCTGLTSVTIPASATNIGDWAFGDCAGLSSVYLEGNAPGVGHYTVGIVYVFTILTLNDDGYDYVGENVTVYCLPGTTGWSSFSATTDYAVEVWTPSTPIVYLQPTNQSVLAGGSAAFSVSAIGIAPLVYQWQFNGTNLALVTNASLVFNAVAASNAGSYDVAITNAYGSITSAVVTLSVLGVPVSFVTNSGGIQYSNGQLHLTLSGLTGQGPVVIEASTNLTQWSPVFTNPPGFGTIQFVDPTAGNYLQRYYRAVVSP